MKTNIFHLRIIPIDKILCHEEYDCSRSTPLIKSLKKDGFIANPIIVADLGSDQYLQLDGMNRICSFQRLGLKTILAQIIDYNDQENVELSSWVHLFRAEDRDFLEYIKNIGDIATRGGSMENIGYRYIKAEGLGRLCTVVFRDGKVLLLSTNGNLVEKINKLRKTVDYYKSQIKRDVLPTQPNKFNIDLLFNEHESCNTMIVFPTFTRHQIIDVVKKGGLFPPGVTRHIIKRRCLSVDVPLSVFKKSRSLEVQNKNLEKILSQKSFRVYEEPTIYFE